MKLFSEIKGIIKAKNIIQKESMDKDLKIGLWNVIQLFIWDPTWDQLGFNYPFLSDTPLNKFAKAFYMYFLKSPLDTMPTYVVDFCQEIRKMHFDSEWYKIYDFLEFIASNFPFSENSKSNFIEACNVTLENELSAYRFVGDRITEITSDEEIEEIDKALQKSPDSIKTHLSTALQLLSNRTNPDYRNSIKESISAVESLCQQIAGDKKATLGQALNVMEQSKKIKLHGALKGSFEKLYGYTSSAEGIRHGLLDEPTLEFEDAKFMLVTCSAFINYLISKSK
ncbi:MAG: hypothetical protein PHY36_02515 [Methanocellales archaeon]|nr:hypothetical protein [Methanocellales archaeon]